MRKKFGMVLMLFALLPGWAGEVRLGDRKLERIVCPADAPASVMLAAGELHDFLAAATGAELPVVAETPAPEGNIFVGNPGDGGAKLAPDSFRIFAADANLHIAGHDYDGPPIEGLRHPWRLAEVNNSRLGLGAFGDTGTLYGVYHFLERFAGIRFYWPGRVGTVIPEVHNIDLPEQIDLVRSPAFTYRHAWFCNFEYAPEDALWYRRAGFGGAYPVQIIDYNYYFTEKLQAEHPEIFAIVDGQRDFSNLCGKCGGGHLCLTHPDTVPLVAEVIKQYFRENPNRYFPLVPGDALEKICECENCQAEIDRNVPSQGQFSTHIWGFVNRVAREVGKEFPDRRIGCLAYEKYLLPPTDIEKLEPNVAVMFCKRRSAMACPEYAERMHRRIEDWKRLQPAELFVWDYYLHTWTPWKGLPVLCPRTIQQDLQYTLRQGIVGEFIEAEARCDSQYLMSMTSPALQHLNLYVTGKLYWDPELDLEALLDEYYRGFYGPAEVPMRRFFELAMTRWEEANRGIKNPHDSIWDVVKPEDVFTPEVMDSLAADLGEAAVLAPPQTVYAERVRQMIHEFENGHSRLKQKKD